MEKKVWSSFMFAAALMCFVFTACVDDTDLGENNNSVKSVVNKPGNPDLDFVPIIDEEPVDSANVTSTVYAEPYEYGIKATIECAEYEYVIERQYKTLNYTYCNTGDHKTLAGLNSETVIGDFAAEDGNVFTVTVKAPVLGLFNEIQRPYWKVRDINITNLRNYAQKGDTLYTEVEALVNFTSVGVDPTKQAALTLKDSVVRIMVAEADRIIGRRYDAYREPKSETQEELQVLKTNIWKSGKETAEPTFIQLLPRSLATITLGEQETTAFGTFTSSNMNLTKGSEVNASDVVLSTNFTALKKRVDVYTADAANAVGNMFRTEYTMTHYGVTFSNEDTTIVFPVADWTVAEVSNVLTNTTGSIANAEYKKMTNNVRTTYLEYVQDASEEGILYKKGDEVTDEGWNTANCWLKVEGKNVIVHGEWVTKHSLSDDVVTKFDSTFVRALSANTWEIYTTSKDNTTGANSITSSSSAKSKGWWSWNVLTNKVTENVAFADGNKQNVFTGTEYENIVLTYKGKKLAFRNYSYEYSEGAVTGPTANGSNDDYDIFKQSTKVNATAQGNQTISATAVGTIYVEQENNEPPFFPSKYGKFEGAKFSATVDPVNRNHWYYGAAVTFEKGTLAVPINRKGEPQWEEATFWEGIKDNALNGAYYAKNKWYPVIASDQNGCMEWSLCSAQGSYCVYMLDYAGADTYGDWNNNDLNKKGQHTVLTDRLKIENDSKKHTMTLFYNGVNKGSWTYSY